MHPIYHNDFIQSIHNKQKVRITFFSVTDGHNKTRLCAPLDFGPKARAKDQSNRYHLWDYESENGFHPLSIFPDDIVTIDFLDEPFDLSFITWTKINWHIQRNWGHLS